MVPIGWVVVTLVFDLIMFPAASCLSGAVVVLIEA
jgi:hypothetical protein